MTNGFPGEIYDGTKADIFSMAVTLFLLVIKSPPFKKANPNSDPYFKRLAKPDKSYFWKIFKNIQTTSEFKGIISDLKVDIFEKMTCPDHVDRFSIEEIKMHPWFICPDVFTEKEMRNELMERIHLVDKIRSQEI
jgi:serine/threonine protein kinase